MLISKPEKFANKGGHSCIVRVDMFGQVKLELGKQLVVTVLIIVKSLASLLR